MHIATWNINSIKMRQHHVSAWLQQHQPDVLLLQEIKCETDAFPAMAFTAAGYQAAVLGQKTYNGVAVLTKQKAEVVSQSLLPDDPQARFMHVRLNGLDVIGIYAPNGNPVETEKFPYKLKWLEQLHDYLQKLLAAETPFVVGGDYNIIPEGRDVYSPKDWENDALFRPESRALWRRFLAMGLTDAFRALHPDAEKAYTFWDYQAASWQRNAGLRIDHFLLSPQAADRLTACSIDREPRGAEKASDHTVVSVHLSD